MIISILCFFITSAYEVLPSWNSSPEAREGSILDYNPDLNSIILYGGSTPDSFFNDIWTFSINDYIWSKLYINQAYSPDPSAYGQGWINKNSFYMMGGVSFKGLCTEIWKFSFVSYTWQRLTIEGTQSFRSHAGFIKFKYSDENYVAIFGGFSMTGLDNTLSILNIDSLKWLDLETISDLPSKRYSPSIQFLENNLYIWGGEGRGIYDTTLYIFSLDSYTFTYFSQPSLQDRVFFGTFIHDSSLYILPGFSYNLRSIISSISKIQLNPITSSNPISIPFSSESSNFPRAFYSSLKINDEIYIFGGKDDIYYNSLLKTQISDSLNFITITQNLLIPEPRMFHTSDLISNDIIIFAGLSYNQQYLSDMWKYNIPSGIWIKVQFENESPIKRSGHASCTLGNSLLIFGGEGPNGYINELSTFDYISNTYLSLHEEVADITPRTGSCMYAIYPYVFIFGGFDGDYKNDLWMIDYRTMELTELITLSPPKAIMSAKCFAEYKGEDLLFYVVLGIENLDLINDDLYVYSKNDNIWTFVQGVGLGRIGGDLKFIDSKIIVFGGSDGFKPKTELIVYDIEKNSIESVDIGLHASDFSSVYFLDSIYVVFGGKMDEDLDIVVDAQRSVIKVQMNDFSCSLGSYLYKEKCVVCKAGTYGVNENSYYKSCIECPPGTFSTIVAAVLSFQCIPCPLNTYNPSSGATKCLSCPSDKSCPINSISPLSMLKISPDFYDSQPKDYVNSVNTSLLQSIDYIIFISIGIGSFIFLLLLRTQIPIGIDIFTENHNYNEGVPMIFKRTMIGAFFSLILILLIIRLIMSEVIKYQGLNTTETKRLLPLVSMENEYNEYKSYITTQYDLYEYGGICIENNVCHSSISYVSENIKKDNEEIVCYQQNTTCQIVHKCYGCLLDPGSSIFFNLNDENSFASSFRISVESDSSIPNEKSLISQVFYPSDENSLFRGTHESIVDVSMTPSLFLSDDSEWPAKQTGYHASFIEMNTYGSTSDLNYLATSGYLKVKIQLIKSQNMLLIQRMVSQEYYQFVSALIGSVFGLLGTMRFFMRTFEKFFILIKKKIEGRKKLDEFRKRISSLVNASGMRLKSFISESDSNEEKSLDN
ncbi:hypothetical protein SteCoe_27038 [Stentor coeruleus]|uniref:Uncharacterized protein n=1 Tax=Stentor coeruleus TaxID=5963 RepID=A0A1R2BBG1_9CILI|nr:hypothetical protein SteCoe_27038 [Stentor coeruleus]